MRVLSQEQKAALQGSQSRGFTLIELLVVIAIIGLLSSVVLASLNTARSKARDVSRREAMQQLTVAFELYFNDNGRYPISSSCRSDGWCEDGQAANWIPGLQPYMSTQPHDPAPHGNSLAPFHYWSDGAHYYLVVSMESAAGTCASGMSFYWPWDPASNTCNWWGGNIYAKTQ